jgi:hypothetical protein
MVIDTVNTTSTTEIPSLINSTMSAVIAKLPYTFHNVQNCSLAEAGECKYGLIHDYQVRTVLLLITYDYQLSVELRIWIENLKILVCNIKLSEVLYMYIIILLKRFPNIQEYVKYVQQMFMYIIIKL